MNWILLLVFNGAVISVHFANYEACEVAIQAFAKEHNSSGICVNAISGEDTKQVNELHIRKH